jgi:hypothetical protein
MKLAKMFTLFWGVLCIGFAFFVGDISPTIIESINKIGSAFYGPVFAVFLAGIISSKAKPLPAIAGLVSGVTVNLFLWLFVPSVSWLWWNVIGFALATAVIFLGSLLFQPAFKSSFEIRISPEKRGWKISYGLLIVYVAGLILFLIFFPKLF